MLKKKNKTKPKSHWLSFPKQSRSPSYDFGRGGAADSCLLSDVCLSLVRSSRNTQVLSTRTWQAKVSPLQLEAIWEAEVLSESSVLLEQHWAWDGEPWLK